MTPILTSSAAKSLQLAQNFSVPVYYGTKRGESKVTWWCPQWTVGSGKTRNLVMRRGSAIVALQLEEECLRSKIFVSMKALTTVNFEGHGKMSMAVHGMHVQCVWIPCMCMQCAGFTWGVHGYLHNMWGYVCTLVQQCRESTWECLFISIKYLYWRSVTTIFSMLCKICLHMLRIINIVILGNFLALKYYWI